jgi:polar amino acid transport system substrate-binding protein
MEWFLAMHQKVLLCFSLWFSTAFNAVLADTTTFTVALYYPQLPPYMYSADDEEPQGVVPELLNSFFAGQPYKLQYVYESRQRAEQGVYSGKYDATVLAKMWALKPKKLLFTLPIVEHNDYLYALAPLQSDVALPAGSSICLRRHYRYTAFADELGGGELLRLDADSEFDQFNMLINGRCELAYMNEHVATWLMNNNDYAKPIYRNSTESETTYLTLALHPKWAKLRMLLDEHIRLAHRNGVIEHSLQSHLKVDHPE